MRFDKSLATRLLLTCAVSLGAGAPAIAGERDMPSQPTLHVRTADLNLMSNEGRHILNLRIRAAAAHVCDYDGVERLSMDAGLVRRSCVAAVVGDANHQLSAILVNNGVDRQGGTAGVSQGAR